jgi:hypothetical protein
LKSARGRRYSGTRPERANYELVRQAMFGVCIKLVPPIIRRDILSDDALVEEFSVKKEVTVTLGESGDAFSQSQLHSAVKSAIKRPGKKAKLSDMAGVSWNVVATVKDRPNLSIMSVNRTLPAGHLLLLGSNKAARIFVIDAEINRLGIPSSIATKWRKLASNRALTDSEFEELVSEFSQSPVAVRERIERQLHANSVTLETLVPRSLSYYESLVGRVEAQSNLGDYLSEAGGRHIGELLKENNGLEFAVLMGSHSLVSQALRSYRYSDETIAQIMRWCPKADILSMCALVESLWPLIPKDREITEQFKALVERFVGIGTADKHDPYHVLSAAFIAVYGELGQTRTLADKPPFWRRLAALAQAAVITRALLARPHGLQKLVTWLAEVRAPQYFSHVYADLRTDPRWLPEWGLPGQLRNEFGGRILELGISDPDRARELEVYDVLLNDIAPSLKSQLFLPCTMLPGPLEGNTEAQLRIPDEKISEMREQLSMPVPNLDSFGSLVSLTNFAQMPPDMPDLAADALRRAQCRLDGSSQSLFGTLAGLAMLAATKRSQRLADELFIVLRNYRRFFRDDLNLDLAFRVGIVASASREEMMDWCSCVGVLVADLAFGELAREEAATVYSLILSLCNLVPELWCTCGQGVAALEAVLSI